MCGVCGVVWRPGHENQPGLARLTVTSMMKAMSHRGPDGEGLIDGKQFALGHRRLSIIDLEHGHQPMSDPTDRLSIAYNGEIYNYRELMREIGSEGWSFHTRSDTEVMLAGYALYGQEFDFRLNGMYAYALLDRDGPRPRIQMAVDPAGIKPMYLAELPSALLFASELRSIVAGMQALGVAPQIHSQGVSQYLALGWTPPPLSLLRGVRKLRPGERLQIDLQTTEITPLTPRPLPQSGSMSVEDALVDSVRRQVISDAPLGFFLSGGVDSSLLVAIASSIGIQPKTFTVRFAGDGHGAKQANEADVAQAVAAHLGTEHRECSVSSETLASLLDECLTAMDQPISDPACLPLLALSRFARQYTKVCLSGDGGDELFAGYPRHAMAPLKQRWRRVPRAVRRIISTFVDAFPGAPTTGFEELLRKAAVAHSLLDAREYVHGPFSGRHMDMLEEQPAYPTWAVDVPYSAEALFEADMLGQLAGQMLPKTDHIAMYASLECRVPFLDDVMISAARAVPLEQKRRNRTGKIPLRRLLLQYLPEELANRPKHGFRVPLTSWLRNDLGAEIRSRLLDHATPVAGAIDRRWIEELLNSHIEGTAEHSIRIWSLLALQSWLDRIAAPSPVPAQ